MAVNVIVVAVTLVLAAFVGVWVFVPRLRSWMEMPKHRFLELHANFPACSASKTPAKRNQWHDCRHLQLRSSTDGPN